MRTARRLGAAAYAPSPAARTEFERLYLPARRRSYAVGLRELGHEPGRTLLDFGCNYGHFLRIARSSGWEARGFEPGDALRRAALDDVRGLIAGSLASAAAAGPYDAVTLWDVLEHIDEPAVELNRIRDLLGPEGRLLVRVPDARVFRALHGDLRWRLVEHPYLKLCHPTNPEEHRHHFTPESLTRVARSAGLEPIGVSRAAPAERVVAGRTSGDTAVRRVLHRLGENLPYEFTMLLALAPPTP